MFAPVLHPLSEASPFMERAGFQRDSPHAVLSQLTDAAEPERTSSTSWRGELLPCRRKTSLHKDIGYDTTKSSHCYAVTDVSLTWYPGHRGDQPLS